MEKMTQNFPVIALCAAAAVLLVLGIWWEISIWNECRETNSYMYCVRLMGRS